MYDVAKVEDGMEQLTGKIVEKCKNRDVYIYGAGEYGRTIMFFLKEQFRINTTSFVVTSKINEETIYGIKVNTIDCVTNYLTKNNQSICIVAVSEKIEGAIIEELKNRNITNYLCFTPEEWTYIKANTKFTNTNPRKNIAVLMYHRVCENNYNFWKLNVSPKHFEEQMRYINENYTVLNLSDDWDSIVEDDKKYIVVTFDDGYVDNCRYALPILKKYDVRATIFLSTELINTNRMYWWDELEKIILIDKFRGDIEFRGVNYRIIDDKTAVQTLILIRNELKNKLPEERDELLSSIRKQLLVAEANTDDLRCVSMSEINSLLDSQVIDLGGHTKSHLSLSSVIKDEVIRNEVKESKDILESYTQCRVTSFAYPYGGINDRCDKAEEIISECGFNKILVVENGNTNKYGNMLHIPRHMIFDDDDIERKLNRIWGLYG